MTSAYPDDALDAARRLEFLTPHHAWYTPFSREVHTAGRTLVDGLAGGPLLKNFMISGAALRPPRRRSGRPRCSAP